MLLHLPCTTSAIAVAFASTWLDGSSLLPISHCLLTPRLGVGDFLGELLFHD